MTPSSPAPGWYPDPTGQPQSRYWDGDQWTSSTQFAGGRPATGTSTGAKVALALGSVVAVLALLGVGVVALRALTSSTSADVLTERGVVAQVPAQPLPPLEPPPPPLPGQRAPTRLGACEYRPTQDEPVRPVPPPAAQDLAGSGRYQVVLDTSLGEIAFVADAARVPCTLASLRSLARGGFYDDSPCHRVTTDGIFVLQCGDPSGSGSGGPGYEYDDEDLPPGLRSERVTYARGTVAMANAGPGTNGSQFFLVYDDSELPPHYTRIGTITRGIEVVEKVAAAGAEGGSGPGDGTPVQPIELVSVTVTAL